MLGAIVGACALVVMLLPGGAQAAHDDCVVDVTPESDTNTLGQSHTLTATLRPEGTNVNSSSSAVCADHGTVTIDFEVTGDDDDATYDPDSVDADSTGTNDLTCDIRHNRNSCSVSYERDTVTGDDSIIARIEDETSVTDTVTKDWVSSGSTTRVLNTTPETDTNPLGTTHTLTATVRSSSGTAQSGVTVDFEVMSGPNEDLDNDSDGPDRSCTTSRSGTCTVTYTDTSADSGETDTVCSWIDSDTDDVLNENGDASDGGDCDSEDRAEGEGSNGWGTDVTDEVSKTWSSTASGTAIYLNLAPEESENELRDEHEITAVARNSNGNVVSGVEVDFEIIDGPNADLEEDEVDMECTTSRDGTCEVSYDDEAAEVGEDDTICGWLDENEDDDYDDDGSDDDGGDCEDEDSDETENSARSGTDVFGNDATDVVMKEWLASSDAFYLNATPESSAGDPGSQYSVSVTARTDAGELAEGVSVDFEVISGPNENLDGQSSDADLECVTNSSGTCSVTYTGSSSTGTDILCAWLDIEDDDDYSESGAVSDGGACDDETVDEPEDSGEPGADTFGNDATDTVRRRWGAGGGGQSQDVPRACRAQGAIVGTDAAETLVGTSGNDIICGLGGGDSILGYGGHDLIIGGGGDDNIRGGGGSDTIRTGGGNDTAVGQSGGDTIRGNRADDYLLGSSGNDLLYGGQGNDILDGGRQFDVCRGGADRDRRIRCED